MTVKVEVRTEDFSAEKESEAVKAASPGAGALVSFIGIVRGAGIRSMELEHYPAMTEMPSEALFMMPEAGGRRLSRSP